MVVIDLPATAETGRTQDRRGAPSSRTVQAPHWPSPQPYLEPVKPKSSRSTVSRGVSGSDWIERVCPLTANLNDVAIGDARSAREGGRYKNMVVPPGGRCKLFLWQRKGVEDAVDGKDDVLPAVELVRHRRGQEFSSHAEVPKSLAVSRIQREQVPGVVRCKEQATRGGQNSRNAFAVAQFVVPDYLAGAVVERTDRGVSPQDAVASAPAFGLCGHGVVVNAVETARVDEQKAGLRIKAGGHPVGGTVGAGRDKGAVRRGRGFGLGDGPPTLVNT